jgi:DNA-binding GntR family transcriptional regulator
MPNLDRTSALLAILRSDHPGLSQQAILDEVRRAILSGDVPPGSPIPVDETAEVFGVSRIPIRETLKTLIGEGLVEHRPRAGYTVASLTVEEFREIYVVRGVLEMAALTAAIGNAGPDDDRRAALALQALDRALATGDFQAYQRESRQFHLALVSPSRMPRLLHMIELVWNLTEPIQPMKHITDEHRNELHAQHSSMLQAFTARDSVELLTVSRSHLDNLEAVVSKLPTETGLFAEPDKGSESG